MAKKQKTIGKLRQSALGEHCTLEIHPHCNGGFETTVLCHMPSPDHGIGLKSPDWWSAYGCSDCHDIIDGRVDIGLTNHEKLKIIIRAIYRTQKRMREKGLISE